MHDDHDHQESDHIARLLTARCRFRTAAVNRAAWSRRRFLRGMGAALMMPAFASLLPRAARAATAAPPTRYAFIYTPNGYWQPSFVPQAIGGGWQATPSLTPLAAVKTDVSILTGLDRSFTPGTGVHAQAGACWLTSAPPNQTLDGGFPTHITVDQLIARRIGGDTPLPSLELSCNDFSDAKETRYFECISWYGPGTAATTEKNPRAVFRRLFGDPRGDRGVKSVLDTVREEARALAGEIGREDRPRFEQYLDSVRATERRIQLAEAAAARIGKPPLPEPEGIPAERAAYIQLMGQLMTLAFQLDLTRVATLVIDPERWDSPRMYHGVFEKPQNHHVLTHTKGDEAKVKLAQIDRFHVQQYAGILQQLGNIADGDGTLLDHSLVVMGSGMSDGDVHNYGDLNVLLAGGASGAHAAGGHRRFDGKVPLANLWLALLQSCGHTADRFADSTAPLTDVLTKRLG